MAATRYFLFCVDANTAYADALLARYNLPSESYASIQPGVTEYSFSCEETTADAIASEVFNGRVPLQFAKAKLPLQGVIGTIVTTPGAPSSMVAGQNASVGTSAAALGSSTATVEVNVQADLTNTDDIFVGSSAAQNFRLSPGQSLDKSISIDNLNKIYVKSASGTQKANYLGSG